MKKRLLSLFLAVWMIVGMIPIQAFAGNTEPVSASFRAVDINTQNPVAGATLQIIKVSNGFVVDEWTSTEDVHTYSEIEPNAEYVLRVTSAPEGYTIPSDTTFAINEDGTVNHTGLTDENGIILAELEPLDVPVPEYVAQVGEQKFASLTEALKNVNEENNTLKLLKSMKRSSALEINKDMTLDLNGYTLKGGSDMDYVLLIAGSNVNIIDSGDDGKIESTKDGSVAIMVTGGTLTVEDGIIKGDDYGVFVYDGTCVVTGGRFSHDPSEYVDKSAYSVTEQDGWYVVSAGGSTEPTPPAADYVAMVGTQGFESLEAALASPLSTNSTITLCKDIKLSTTLNITKNVTIDLGEYDITSFGNIFEVAANGELLIKGSGTISGNNVVTVRGGKVTVESGNISANTYGMMVWSGNVTILGGTIHGRHTGIYYSSGNHGIYGGTVSGGTYGVKVAGGKCEITGGRFSHDPSQYVDKSAYSVTEQDGWFVVSSTGGTEPTPPASDYVAMVGEQGYETLQAAVNAAQSGDTIELLKDVNLTAIVTVPAGKNITLDLGGKTIESIGYSVFGDEFTDAVLKVCGELTITDSGVGGKICCNAVADLYASCGVYVLGGTLNIEGGTISCDMGDGYIYGVYVEDGTVNISGGKIEVTGNTDHAVAKGVFVLDGTLNIEDGTIKVTGNTSYGVDGEYRTANKVNISGGKIEATGYGVHNKSTVNIEGTANISGGEGSVLNRKTANIKGGTFSGTIQNEGNGAIAISGGKFDKDPSQYVDSDKYQVTTENNWYFVEEKAQPVYVAMIGEQGYETLQAAYEAVNDTNNTITLLKNVDLGDNYLDIRKKVTIDLDGYKISGEGIVFNIYSGGELSISGGTISADIGAILWNGNLTAADMNISAETGGIYLASDNVIANIESGNISGGIYGVEVAGGTANITGGTVWGGTYGVNVSYNGIVNISGNANISGSYGVHINGDYDPEANITGGTVSGTVNGVYVQSGNATITGGTVSGNNGLSVEANGTATIAGGTVTGGISGAVVYGELEITGGTVTGDTQGVFSRGTVTISGGTVSGEADGVFVLGSGIVDITGGRFSHDPSDFVPNTHQVTETEGWYVVSEKPQAEYVAEVGTQGYESLQAAYAAVNDTNNTITLLKDVDLGSAFLEVNKKLTLDLNGNTIKNTHDYTIIVRSDGDLTISSSVEGGTISGGGYGIAVDGGTATILGGNISARTIGVNVQSGTANIEGGTISGRNAGVYASASGTLNISGGNITSDNDGVLIQTNSTANISGGTVSGYRGVFIQMNSTANISGGTISGSTYGVYVQKGTANITGGRFNTDPSQYVNSALYQVTTEDGWFVVSKATKYNITVGTTVNGTVEVDKTSAKAGEIVTVTVTPMPGYELTNLSYKKNGMNIGIMGNSFAMPTGDVEVVATFKALPTYRIMMPSTFKGGTVTVDDTEAYAGQEVTVTVAANEGYELAFVSVMTVQGTQITLTDGKFTMPAEVVMITAAFKEKASYVAQVGEQKFESLQAAIDAAEDGETVVLLSDITLTNDNIVKVEEKYTIMLKVAGKSITLDMNGQNINVDYEGDAQLYAVIFVADGAELIVTGEGTIDVSENGIHIAYMFWKRGETGKMTIENGTYHMDDATDSMVYTNGNEIVEVKGGTFTLDAAGTRVNGFPCIFNAAGSNLRSIKVSGGTYNTNIAEQYWTKEVSLVDAEGNLMAVTKNADGTYTVGSAEAYIEKMVGNNNLTKIGYATLAAAIASVEKNAPETTIVLLKDVKVSGQYIGHSYAQKIVLDLNGKTLSSADRTLNVYRGGTEVLIKNGTVTGNTTAGTIQVSGGAKLTLENATIKSGSKAKAIKINKDGTLVINDASVKVQGGLDDLIVETGAQTLISAGTFNHDVSDYCVEEYGAVKNTDGTYTVKRVILVENVTTGGKYETVAAAIAAIGKNAGLQELKLLGDVTVKGQFVGHSYAQQVVIDLNGFKMSSTDKALTVYRAGTEVTIKNGTVYGNSTGGTIQVTYGGKLTLGENVTITSGGSANALKIDSPATLIIASDTVKVQGGKNDLIVADGTKVEISAGYFKHPVAEAWCAEGKMPNPVKTADGWYTVMDAGAAVINGKAYETLHDAFAAVENGETIKVMKNIDLANEETVTLAEQYKTYFKVEGKYVTIDLNGKTISGTAGNADNMLVGVFSTENDGHLTITGEGTVDVQDGGKVYALIVNYEDGCSIVIENGTYKLDAASDSLIYCGAGYAEGTEGILVQDGTFHLGNLGKGPNGNGSPWIFNAYYKNQNHIMVNGGTFNADVNHQFWANEVFVPETLALKDNDNGTWTVVEAAGYVVEIGVSQYSRARKVGYVDLAAFEGEDVLGNKDGEYFVTGAGSLKQFAEEVGGAVKLENSNIAMTEDITVAENKELLMESDSKIAFNGGGNTITANGTGTKAGESYDYGYVGFIPANKEAATVENVTVTGSGFVEVGHHGTSMGGEYTINNLTVKDLIATLAVNNGGNNIAAAFSHYGNAVMTDCVMTGTTTLKEGFKAYDAAFVNTTKTVMSGCTFGKIYIANQAHVTITNTVIDVIDSYAISTRNLGKLVIGAGAEIGVINLYDTGSYKATLVIEEGANVGAIVYNGVTYTVAEWMAR